VKLSERELIARWRQMLPRAHGRLRLGIGDDAALYDIDDESIGIFTTDMLVQDVHFKAEWGTYADLGWKSVVVNVSDIAAMGGEPRLVLIAAALPAAFSERDADAILKGAQECAGAYGAQIAGGDTVRSSGPLVISVAAFGEAVRTEVLRRDAAKVGDVIATTGSFGGAAAALHLYREKRKPPADLASRLHRPLARVEEGQLLARAGARCGIDCSDGLLRSLDLLCEASGVTASIEEERVPVDPSATRVLGGEDYELVVAASDDVLRAAGVRLTVIGEIVPATSARVLLRRIDGSVRLGVDDGYDAFR
jgi:thiamine-monophosphate kinase